MDVAIWVVVTGFCALLYIFAQVGIEIQKCDEELRKCDRLLKEIEEDEKDE